MKPKRNLFDYHRCGYVETNKRRIEFYLTILNDLAEDTTFKRRMSVENLCEVIGYLQRENQKVLMHYQKALDEVGTRALMLSVSALKAQGIEEWVDPGAAKPKEV